MKYNTFCMAALAVSTFAAAPSASAQGFFQNVSSGFQNLTKDFSGQWQGPYAGVGFNIDKTSMEFPGQNVVATVDVTATAGVEYTSNPTFNRDDNGESYNLIAGYRLQKGNVVFGVEGDLQNGKTEFTLAGRQVCQNPNTGVSGSACFEADAAGSLETKGHISGLVGYSVTRDALAYATVGAAFAEVGALRYFEKVTAPGGSASGTGLRDISDNVTGLSLGAGLETRISNHVSLRLSYQHEEFKDIDTRAGGSTPAGGGSVTSGGIAYALNYNLGTEQTWTTDAVEIAALYQF